MCQCLLQAHPIRIQQVLGEPAGRSQPGVSTRGEDTRSGIAIRAVHGVHEQLACLFSTQHSPSQRREIGVHGGLWSHVRIEGDMAVLILHRANVEMCHPLGSA